MTRYDTVRRAIEQIASAEQPPSLAELAAQAGQSPAHFQRGFVQLAGVSPKELQQALTLERAKAALLRSASVQDAAWDAGLSGPSRLHDLFLSVDGLTPGEFKRAGQGMALHWTVLDSVLGPVFMAATERGILRIAFLPEAQAEPAVLALQAALPGASCRRDDAALAEPAQELQRRLGGQRPMLPLGLLLSGSPLRLKVWQALMAVPEGQLISYAELAHRVGSPRAVRAVASCVAANELAYLIPCHRVIRSNARWGEYRWGARTKTALIGLELARHPDDRTQVSADRPA